MTSSPLSYDNSPLFERRPLQYNPNLWRNRFNQVLTGLAALFAAVAVLPLFLVLLYVLVQGGRWAGAST